MPQTLLCIGTKKGLFLARSEDRVRWELDGPHFRMSAVYAVAVDSREGRARVLAGADSPHLGPCVAHSDDLGATWSEAVKGAVRFPPGYEASVERVWQLRPAGPEQPGVVYAGAEPSSLWRSEDGGESFSLVEGLWEHPHRADWQPGYGGQCLHTILPDPADPQRVLVAMSTGGVYRTEDGGRSWNPSNHGIQAYFLPDPYPEYGQCVHKVAADAERPDRLYLQNHGGVYRSDDGGRTWASIADSLPAEFGFPVAAHPRRGGTAYLFPLEADANRVPAGERCRVYRTDDAGESWRPLERGLPQSEHFGVVLRDALTVDDGDPAGVYFGTRNGEVYGSPDEGEQWHLVAAHLPDVLCVRAAVLP
jgi:photosystem II stability/assembly factor-like uncharacterized protein